MKMSIPRDVRVKKIGDLVRASLAVLVLATSASDVCAAMRCPDGTWCEFTGCTCAGHQSSPSSRPSSTCPGGVCPPTVQPRLSNSGTSSSSRITPGDVNAIGNAIGNLLDSQSRAAEAEQERQRQYEREKAQKQQSINARTQQLIKNAAENPDTNPWATSVKSEKSDDAAPKLTNCDCAKIVGTCLATIKITPTASTKGSYGAELAIRANVQRCAKVSYFVDSTPYFTLLSQGNSATDSVWGQRPVTDKTLSDIECHVCSSTGP